MIIPYRRGLAFFPGGRVKIQEVSRQNWASRARFFVPLRPKFPPFMQNLKEGAKSYKVGPGHCLFPLACKKEP